MTSLDDLVAWLRDVFDQRERKALAAADYGAEWRYSDSGIYPSDESRHPGAIVTGSYGDLEKQYGEHIAINDPGQILADVAADRAFLALHSCAGRLTGDGYPAGGFAWCTTCGSGEAYEYPTEWPCAVVRLLASKYAAWPGYRPEWAPAPA